MRAQGSGVSGQGNVGGTAYDVVCCVIDFILLFIFDRSSYITNNYC